MTSWTDWTAHLLKNNSAIIHASIIGQGKHKGVWASSSVLPQSTCPFKCNHVTVKKDMQLWPGESERLKRLINLPFIQTEVVVTNQAAIQEVLLVHLVSDLIKITLSYLGANICALGVPYQFVTTGKDNQCRYLRAQVGRQGLIAYSSKRAIVIVLARNLHQSTNAVFTLAQQLVELGY